MLPRNLSPLLSSSASRIVGQRAVEGQEPVEERPQTCGGESEEAEPTMPWAGSARASPASKSRISIPAAVAAFQTHGCSPVAAPKLEM